MIQIEIDRFLQIFVVVTFDVILGRVIEFRVICLLLRYYSVESVDFVSLLTLYAEYQESRNHSVLFLLPRKPLYLQKQSCVVVQKSYMLLNFKRYLIIVSVNICISYFLDQPIKIVCLNLHKICHKPLVGCQEIVFVWKILFLSGQGENIQR